MLMIFMIFGCSSQPPVSSTGSRYYLSSNQLQILKGKAINGDAASSFRLAGFYESNKNDFNEAEFWYRLSAEQGHKDAALILAYLYQFHFKNYEKAIYWLEKNAPQDELAYTRLGELYEAKFQFEKAEIFYCRAYLLKGDISPANSLAKLFRKQGNNVFALAWLILYSQKLTPNSYLFQEAQKEMADIKRIMPPESVESANNIATSISPCHKD